MKDSHIGLADHPVLRKSITRKPGQDSLVVNLEKFTEELRSRHMGQAEEDGGRQPRGNG